MFPPACTKSWLCTVYPTTSLHTLQILHDKSVVVWNLYCDRNRDRQLSFGQNLRRCKQINNHDIYTNLHSSPPPPLDPCPPPFLHHRKTRLTEGKAKCHHQKIGQERDLEAQNPISPPPPSYTVCILYTVLFMCIHYCILLISNNSANKGGNWNLYVWQNISVNKI